MVENSHLEEFQPGLLVKDIAFDNRRSLGTSTLRFKAKLENSIGGDLPMLLRSLFKSLKSSIPLVYHELGESLQPLCRWTFD